MRPDDYEGFFRSIVPLLPEVEEVLWRLGGGDLSGSLLLVHHPPAWWDGRGLCAVGHREADEVVVDIPVGELTRFQLDSLQREMKCNRLSVPEAPKAVGQRFLRPEPKKEKPDERLEEP